MTQDDLLKMALHAGWHGALLDLEDVQKILIKFARMVEQQKCKELADKIEVMPFGDTAASFSMWVRQQSEEVL